MKTANIGETIPDFSFVSTDANLRSFKDLLGQNIVLYFYPKDNTPGCTQEGKDFAELNKEFLKANTCIIGVSRDSLTSHQKFCAKLSLPFPLITDPNEALCKYFEVMIEKNMFKKFFLGIERSTFLIDSKGKIKQAWRKVKVKGHAQEVLNAAKNL